MYSAKSLARRTSPGAVGLGDLDAVLVADRGRLPVAAPAVGAGGRRPDLGLAVAPLLPQGAQVHGARRVLGLAPEDLEGLVKRRQVLLPVHQKGPEGFTEVTPAGDAHVFQRLGHVHHAPGVHVHARAPQDSAEEQQVVEEVAV